MAQKKEFDSSSALINITGLDWHYVVGSKPQNKDLYDQISFGIAVFFYPLAFLINIVLLYATLTNRKFYALIWVLLCAIAFSSKCSTFFYHLTNSPERRQPGFILFSLLYIGFLIFTSVVLKAAYNKWHVEKEFFQVIFRREEGDNRVREYFPVNVFPVM